MLPVENFRLDDGLTKGGNQKGFCQSLETTGKHALDSIAQSHEYLTVCSTTVVVNYERGTKLEDHLQLKIGYVIF